MFKKNQGVVTTACICLLFIVAVLWAYYGAVFGEKKPEKKKEISVVLYYSGTNGWESLMQGLKQAEDDFSVNINYVIAKEGMGSEAQMALVQREIENGAQGILLAAVDSATDYQMNWPEGAPVPIVTIESGLDGSSYTHISADDYEMGRVLGEAVLEDFAGAEQIPLYIVDTYIERDSVNKRLMGLLDAIGEAAVIYDSPRYAAAEVALCKESLQTLCEDELNLYLGKRLYGVGNTPNIVAAMAKGQIEKIVFQNEFNIGYIGVKTLMDEMNGLYTKESDIDFYLVGVKELYELPYEQLLFPIVE